MLNSVVKLVLAPENKVVTIVGQGDVLSGMGDTQSNRRGVFRAVHHANTFTTGNDGINPSEDVSKTRELSSVVAARGSTSKRRMPRVT